MSPDMFATVKRPTLVINERICRANISRMAEKARQSGVVFRPHFKTHQSLQVGRWFRDYGVEKITVSSLTMARRFAEDGWNDITIAFPFNLREINEYPYIAGKPKLNLLVDSPQVLRQLAKGLEYDAGIFIEIDTGYGRSGIYHKDIEKIREVLKETEQAGQLSFAGFLTHAGNTYAAGGRDEVVALYRESVQSLLSLKTYFPGAMLSAGDTPSCSLVRDHSMLDEIRPGNFVYYDLMQYGLGSCSFEDIGVCVACPVSGIYPERNEVVVYGGAVHLSKEAADHNGKRYGLVVSFTEKGWTRPLPETVLITLSQEHGIIRTSPEVIRQIKYGDLLGIIPVHSCLTANLLKDDTLIIP